MVVSLRHRYCFIAITIKKWLLWPQNYWSFFVVKDSKLSKSEGSTKESKQCEGNVDSFLRLQGHCWSCVCFTWSDSKQDELSWCVVVFEGCCLSENDRTACSLWVATLPWQCFYSFSAACATIYQVEQPPYYPDLALATFISSKLKPHLKGTRFYDVENSTRWMLAIPMTESQECFHINGNNIG